MGGVSAMGHLLGSYRPTIRGKNGTGHWLPMPSTLLLHCTVHCTVQEKPMKNLEF